MSLFLCPVCREKLFLCGKSLKCAKLHSFDKSSAGDVYLLRSSKLLHGDSREMICSRRDFLDKGYYSFLREKIAETALKYAPCGTVNYFDAGCGTGYYTERVVQSLSVCTEVNAVGIDISKDAVRMSAKRVKTAEFAVAGLYDLPLPDDTFDIVTNIFSPMAHEEIFRVMKSGGFLIYVTPAEKHLYSLKKVLYDNPYENEEKITEYPSSSYLGKIFVKNSALLEKEMLLNLFAMTPYYWRTDAEGVRRLSSCEKLEVEFEFNLHIYKKD